MKKFIPYIVVVCVAVASNLGGCSYRNIDDITKNAPAAWGKIGFEIIGSDGYTLGNVFESPGGRVWFVVQRKGDPSIRYEGFVTKWRGEYHIYNIKAIDAIKP